MQLEKIKNDKVQASSKQISLYYVNNDNSIIV